MQTLIVSKRQEENTVEDRLNGIRLNTDWDSFLTYRERKLVGIQTGILPLDRILLGLSGIVVIQGSPGVNKSVLAAQIGGYQASLGNPVLFIDRENGRNRFRMRLLCQANRVSQIDVLTCSKDRLRELVRTVNKWPVFVETEPVDGYTEIKEMLERLGEQFPGRPILLIIDSLQAMPALNAEERLSLQLWLKQLDQAKLDFEGRLTIVATSEKRRGENGLEYERASLSAGKGAGAVEYKAEMVLDLRRNRENGNIICEVVKNRDGQSGVFTELRPVLSNPTDPSSFTFRLEGA
jgi:replicative DNA helicase